MAIATVKAMAVHPRGRGERREAHERQVEETGSSPRTRGTRRRERGHHRAERFIPADAGNASERLDVMERHRFIPADAGNALPGGSARCPRAVHPRGRGERGAAGSTPITGSGSSPRTRGTLPDGWKLVPVERFIPADAGNAFGAYSTPSITTVHPRGRGERPVSARCA